MNKNLLRSKLALAGDTYESLADFLGLAKNTVTRKINESHGAEFTQSEISMMKERYSLTDAEVIDIFFTR